VVSTRTKHDWIVAALGQLGLATTQQYGLYANNEVVPGFVEVEVAVPA
jgi:hypothetical protein